MNEPVRAVLLGHGGMAEGMMDAVRHITGCEADAINPLSNRGLSPELLAERVQLLAGDGPAILFTDLPSGSCGFAARHLAQRNAQLVVVSGVNLAVLIEFVMHRQLPITELVPRLLSKGRAAIGCAPASLEIDGHSAAARR